MEMFLNWSNLYGDVPKPVQAQALRLYVARGDGAQEVPGGHVDVLGSVSFPDIQGSKVAEYLVGRAVGTDTILVANHTTVVEADVFLGFLLLFLLS